MRGEEHDAVRRREAGPDDVDGVAISAEEAERFKAPAAYAGPSPVPQPAYDPEQPHMVHPEQVYRKILAMPDDVLTESVSYATPPVRA